MTRIGPTGVLVTDAEPHSDEWHAARFGGVGSSDITSILGIPGAYSSPFDLWWERFGREIRPANAAMSWGTRLEPVIADAFAAAHPEFYLSATGVIMHRDRPWQRCSPDRLIFERATHEWDGDPDDWQGTDVIADLECKSDNNRAGWGEPGTDQIPPHYLAQVRWQLDTIGLTTAFVAVTFGGPPVEYVVEHDEEDAVLMREAARDFLDRLEAGTPPPIDSHTATTRRLKTLHPTVDGTDVPIEEGLIAARRDAAERLKVAEDDVNLLDNQIKAAMGDAQYGYVNGAKAVSRSVYDVRANVIERDAYTVNKLIFTKPKDKAS